MLFRKVMCNAYLAKVNDGRFIISQQDRNGNIESCSYVYMNETDGKTREEEIEECCGELEFLKTYYERKEKVFEGVIVGIKEIVVKGYLYADTTQNPYHPDRIYVGKHPKEVVKCAVVYFANNRKRYVPLEDMEEADGKKTIREASIEIGPIGSGTYRIGFINNEGQEDERSLMFATSGNYRKCMAISAGKTDSAKVQ